MNTVQAPWWQRLWNAVKSLWTKFKKVLIENIAEATDIPEAPESLRQTASVVNAVLQASKEELRQWAKVLAKKAAAVGLYMVGTVLPYVVPGNFLFSVLAGILLKKASALWNGKDQSVPRPNTRTRAIPRHI